MSECKTLLAELNNQLARKESFERLLDIYAQFSPKSYTIYNRHLRFTKHDLLQHKRLRQLLHSDGQIRIWSATRRKLFQVLCLILNDIVVFLRIDHSSSSSSHLQPSAPASLNSSALGYHQHHLSAAALNNCESIEPAGERESLPLIGGQCALINVVAQALHSAASASEKPLNERQSQCQQQAQLQQPQQSKESQQQVGISVKYYFANIDNKSSVISLSKLLIREKAVNDAEPRIYLISSSPRQPEMYELAFVSKRHQVSFVEKLKSCIEQHNNSLSQLVHVREHDLSLMSDDCCDSDEEIEDLDIEIEEPDDFEREDDESDGLCGHAHTTSDCDEREAAQLEESGEFEKLDIEQDVVPAPQSSNEELVRSSDSCAPAGDHEPSSFVYQQQQPETRLLPESGSDDDEEPDARLASTESGLSERAKDSLDEAAPGKQKLRSVRRRRAQRPRQVSNQSSSSSEAAHRQAIQLMGVASAGGQSEAPASLRYEEEFDSGRGQDDSSSAASTSSNSLGCRASASLKAADQSVAVRKPEVGANASGGQLQAPIKSQQSAEKASLSSSCASSTASGSSNPTAKSNLVKCSSILSKSSCSFMKQRKLSTVSTMSSQLKLFNKFKDERGAHLCAQCQQLNGSRAVVDASNESAASSLSQQSTLNKQLRQQMRRSSFIPEQKLEELRDLRIQLDKDKEEWQAKFDAMQEQLLNERRELDLAREKLKLDRQQVANEREQLYRKLDVLKEKGILLSPSHKVIITTPDLRIYPHQQHTNNHHHHHHQQQQVSNQHNNNYNNQRQPLHNLNGNHSGSVRIVQQHHQQQQSANCQQQALNYSHPVNMSHADQAHAKSKGYCHQATNLFIQSSASACKVPLHLSENVTNAIRPLSLGFAKSSLCASLLSDRLGLGSNHQTSKQTGANLESHLI